MLSTHQHHSYMPRVAILWICGIDGIYEYALWAFKVDSLCKLLVTWGGYTYTILCVCAYVSKHRSCASPLPFHFLLLSSFGCLSLRFRYFFLLLTRNAFFRLEHTLPTHSLQICVKICDLVHCCNCCYCCCCLILPSRVSSYLYWICRKQAKIVCIYI